MAQVIAGIVLAKSAQEIENTAADQDHLDTERQLARGAVANHIQATGIGAEIAADRTAPLGRQVEREVKPLLLCRLVKRLQDATRLHGHRHVDRINLADPVHPAKRQQDAVSCIIRGRAAHETGIAALWHDGDIVPVGKGHHL